MERELGLNRADLPHGYEPVNRRTQTAAGDGDKCYCGRDEDHALHQTPQIQETASYSGPAFETEKGI